jgi:hypothetical protein
LECPVYGISYYGIPNFVQALCLTGYLAADVFSLERCVEILDPAPHPSPLPRGEGEREQIFMPFKTESDPVLEREPIFMLFKTESDPVLEREPIFMLFKIELDLVLGRELIFMLFKA